MQFAAVIHAQLNQNVIDGLGVAVQGAQTIAYQSRMFTIRFVTSLEGDILSKKLKTNE